MLRNSMPLIRFHELEANLSGSHFNSHFFVTKKILRSFFFCHFFICVMPGMCFSLCKNETGTLSSDARSQIGMTASAPFAKKLCRGPTKQNQTSTIFVLVHQLSFCHHLPPQSYNRGNLQLTDACSQGVLHYLLLLRTSQPFCTNQGLRERTCQICP